MDIPQVKIVRKYMRRPTSKKTEHDIDDLSRLELQLLAES